MKPRKIKKQIKRGGFDYYRSREQIVEYMKVSAINKLRWLEEMWQFNTALIKSNPKTAIILNRFRKGY